MLSFPVEKPDVIKSYEDTAFVISEESIRYAEQKKAVELNKDFDFSLVNKFAIKYGVNKDLLREVIWCESWFDPLAIHYNKDGSADFGLLQVNNKHHEDTMVSMGYVYDDEVDSLEYGVWLMSTPGGIKHWKYSKFCWEPKL